MNWISGLQCAVDYVEEHLTEDIDYIKVAERAYSSVYHFCRIFGIVCGFTLGEYIRKRRLTLAAAELLEKRVKVTDAAFKYGYETPESFSRAFYKFHGVMPSQVKQGCPLKSFSRLTLKVEKTGCNEMNYRVEERQKLILFGYKKRFEGVPFGDDRERQEDAFFRSTRAKQWLLRGASHTPDTSYCIVNNIDEKGYDFYIAYNLDEWTRKEIFNSAVTGVNFMEQMGFEQIMIPSQTYVVFETPKMRRPIMDYIALRKRIVTEWLTSSNYIFAEAPEVAVMHWPVCGESADRRFIEICIPIEKN